MKDTDWEIIYELHKNPNITKVANLLYISQPSLTKRIQHIENEFQVAVIERTARGIRFTKEGEYLAEQAVKYMELEKETRETLDKWKDNKQTQIVLGASYTYTKYTLSSLLAAYRQLHPDVLFSVVNEQSNILFRKVLEGSVDAAVIRGDYDGPVYQKLLGKNRACLVSKNSIEDDELLDIPLLKFRTNDKSKEILDRWWIERFGDSRPVQEMDVGYIDFAWQFVSDGAGYCLCFLPENFRNDYNLNIVPLTYNDGTPVTRNTWFVYPKSKLLSSEILAFIDYIEEHGVIKENDTYAASLEE